MAQSAKPFALETLERKKLLKLRERAKDIRIHHRLSALLWLDDGYSVEEVARLLDVCPRTVKNWIAFYTAGGVDRLCSLDYRGDPG
jgi:transposase